MSLNRLGDLLVTQGELAAARLDYEASVEVTRRLVATHPSDTAFRSDLVMGEARLANMPGAVTPTTK